MCVTHKSPSFTVLLFVCALGIISLLGCQQGGQDGQDQQAGSGVIQAGKYTILDTRTDQTDRARAKQNVEDAIISYPDVDCFVGLWSYNPPAILSAVKDSNMQGKIHIVAFDEEEDTLQGIKDGHIYGTIAQQPFQFGYQSVSLLTELARGNDSILPDNGVIYVPVTVVKQDNVDQFWQNLKDMVASVENARISSLPIRIFNWRLSPTIP